jgi:uncharacterized Tic20 family protein
MSMNRALIPTEPWERTYAMWVHLTTAFSPVAFPLTIVAAVILWSIQKDRSSYIDDHGKEVLNFQLSTVIYYLACMPLIFVLGLGVVLMVALSVVAIIGIVLGAVAAFRGEFFRYPICLRFIR